MKRLIILTVGVVGLFALFAFKSMFNKPTYQYIIEEVGTPTVLPHTSDNIIGIPGYSNSYIGFKEALAIRESQGRYRAINSLGYLGRYQFGPSTLRLLKIRDFERFLHRPELQERALRAYLAYNKWLLQDEIEQYCGAVINGVEITESGILASAHLAGSGSVRRYLKTNGKRKAKDAYGTRIDAYMEEFAYYDLSGIKPLKNPRV